jgi:NADH-quinone oxidoreductase subunit M
MHNRVGPNVESYDLSVRDGLILVPLVLAIIAFAVYPQQALRHSEPTVQKVVGGPEAVAQSGVTP